MGYKKKTYKAQDGAVIPEGVYNPFTGIDTSGRTGGYDQYGQGIAAMIPGGGAIAGVGQAIGGVANLIGSRAANLQPSWKHRS